MQAAAAAAGVVDICLAFATKIQWRDQNSEWIYLESADADYGCGSLSFLSHCATVSSLPPIPFST